MIPQHRVIILVFDRANLQDVAGPAQVFFEAGEALSKGDSGYKVILVSVAGGMITTNCGIQVKSISLDAVQLTSTDTLIIAGGSGVMRALSNLSLLNWIPQQSKVVKRLGSVCTGAFLLAACGLLDGKRAVTHWQYADQLQQNFPNVLVEVDPIYVSDNNIWSSAGVTAGIDMALAMVKHDHGHQVALQVARAMVVFIQRPGGQSQFSAALQELSKESAGRFVDLHNWIRDNPTLDLTVDRLADFMHMSSRNFSRVYSRDNGTSPSRAVEIIRLEKARQYLEAGQLNINQIGRRCGFGGEERLRRTFLRHTGITPHVYRKRFRVD